MRLNVFVNGRAVATLQSHDNFEHQLAYLASADQHDQVSIQMPHRERPWSWPALHPFFQMNWPDVFLHSVLKNQLRPGLGAGALNLLAAVGHQLPGRVSVSNTDTAAAKLALPDARSLLRGRSSQAKFFNLILQSIAVGLPGLALEPLSDDTKVLFQTGSIYTERHIVKASSMRLPFLALNEHLCLQACYATGYRTAMTEVSEDGQMLLVERCDSNPQSTQYQGFEDFCSLLGLPPEDRYDSSWERQARLVRDYIDPGRVRQANEQLAVTLMLSLVLGHADQHSKSLALIYDRADDVRLAPISSMQSTLAYDVHAVRSPGLYLDSKKNWDPGTSLWRYMQQHLGLENPRQRELTDLVCTSVAGQVPAVLHHINHTPGFVSLGRSMLSQWSQGLKRLSGRLTVPAPDFSTPVTAPLPDTQDPTLITEKEADPSQSPIRKTKTRLPRSSPSAQVDQAQLKLQFD